MTYETNRRYNANHPNRWQDWVNLALAVWLFFSPWILQFGSDVETSAPAANAATLNAVSNGAWNAWILSVIVLLVTLSAIGRIRLWQEWVNLVLGAWIFVAPWVLGFATGRYPAAAWDHWIVGGLIFLLSASILFGNRPAELGERQQRRAHEPQDIRR